MQKKLIALAVAGLVSGGAFAQSNVTISGLMRMSVEQYKAGTNTAGTNQSYNYNAVSDQSSMLVFSGKEDMGGGMYAGFQIDNRLSGDLGAFAASGNTNINIGGTWGKLSMGRQDLHYGTAIESYKAYTLQQILSNGLFAQVNGNAIANTTRTPNSVWYDSPNISGFSARIAVSSAFAATEGTGARAVGGVDPSKGSATNLALNYANGPITAGYSYWRATVEGGTTAAVAAVPATASLVTGVVTAAVAAAAATADQRGDTLQASYTLPMGLKLGLAWNRSKLDYTTGDLSRTAWILPVSYSFGANQLAFTYAKANNSTGSFLASNADTGASAYTLSFGHSLSKRTNIGVNYTKLDNRAAATYNLFALAANGAPASAVNGAGSDQTQFAVNVNHSF